MIQTQEFLKILIIEDDAVISEILKEGFEKFTNFQLTIAKDGNSGLDFSLNLSFDLILLDLMLPGLNGESILKEIRKNKIYTPILVISAKETVEDKVTGLTLGADDYLTKPFSFNELLARIMSLTRRVSQFNPDAVIEIDDLSIHLNKRKIFRSGKEIVLQHNEFELLNYFVQNQNQVLTKGQILKKIWGYNFNTQTNVVDVLVCRLRNKLERDYPKKFIHTLRGLGYVFKKD